jgi:hypothetical protein
MHRRQNRINFGQALVVLAGLVAFASAGETGPGGIFARWSTQDEITSLRTEDSRTFDNHDGTRSVVIAGPMNRQVAPGVWQELGPDAEPLDDSVVQVGEGTYPEQCIWQTAANFYCCQHLYLASELNFSGTILRIAFFSAGPEGTDTLRRSHHYLMNTTDTCFTDWHWQTPGTEVWTGDLLRDSLGWLDLPLQHSCFHPSDSNLLVSYRHCDGTSEVFPEKRYHATDYSPSQVHRSKYGGDIADTLPTMTFYPRRANIQITYAPAPPPVDVQAVAIVSPTDSVLWGQPCVPKVLVRNKGVYPADFPVQFRIGDGYVNSVDIHALQPGAEDTVSFPSWTPGFAGWLSVQCSTGLVGDQDPENDTLSGLVFVVYHDVGVGSILAPSGIVPLGDSVLPVVMARNYGTWDENTWIVTRILRDSAVVYADSIEVRLLPASEALVPLDRYWHAESTGAYDVSAWTSLPGDMNHSNDTVRSSFQVQYLPLHDVGAIRIIAPLDSVSQDSVIQPVAVIHNFGRASEDVPVGFTIIRNSVVTYTDSGWSTLAPGASDTIAFRPWTAGDSGSYLACVRTCLPGDQDSTNDAVSDSFRVTRRLRYDIAVEAILAPAGTIDTGETCAPRVRIRNLGDYAQTGVARFTIIDSGGMRQTLPEVRLNQLEPGTTRDTFFTNWTAHHPGQYVARCSLEFAPDNNHANDTLSRFFVVQEPTPWHQVANLPEGDRHKSVRGGAALASGGLDLVYALKGNSTREFYSYHVTGDSWSRCCSIPRTRRSTRSAALCYSQGTDLVYAASAGSGEFWQYRPEDNTWQRQADVMAGVSGRRPGNGVCLAATDTGCVYLLRGNGTGEFSAFDHNRDTWVSLAPVPTGVSGRGCRAGSCLIAVRDYLYLLKGGGNEFFAYSTLDDTWYNRTPLPMAGPGTGRKTAKAGTSIAHGHDVIYVLKGGKCGDLWWYDTFGDSWIEQRSLPLGPGLRPVADGGALAFADGKLWALKGNGTLEFWAYQPLAADRSPLADGRSRQAQSQSAVHAQQFAVGVHPNPFANNAMVFCSVPVAGELNLKLYDVNGRLVQTLWSGPRPAGAFSTVLTEPLPLGVYLLRASSSTESTTCRLIHH